MRRRQQPSRHHANQPTRHHKGKKHPKAPNQRQGRATAKAAPLLNKLRQGKKQKTIASKLNNKALHRAISHRLIFALSFALVIFLVIMGRLGYLQLIQGGELTQKAADARSYSVTMFHRGNILDRHGNVLAQDQILYDAFAHPQYFNDLTPAQIAKAIAPVLQAPEKRLKEQLSRPYSTIRLGTNVPLETVKRLKRLRVITDEGKSVAITGLDFPKKTVRRYPQGTLGAHVLGYVNDDASTSSGIEYSQQATLKYLQSNSKNPAESGQLLDGRGQLMAVEEGHGTTIVSSPKSDDVVLTLDTRLQFLAEKALATGLERAKASRGSVIILKPQTGEILAFAVAPNYNPEQYYRAPYHTLKNWALSDVYPPGSTMKILTVANGIETGAIDKHSRILDTGKMKIGGWTIQNYDYYRRPHPGMIDLTYLFEHSSNIASAKISLQTPKGPQYELLEQLGLGRKTGISLPGESAGILPPFEDWSESTHGSLGYGYGLAATPLQMAAAVATIANDGIWVQPHVVKKAANTIQRRRVYKTDTALAVQEALEASINRPKRSTVKIPGVRIAGKTGTSRKPSSNGKGYSNDIFTSFVGFYPVEQPKVLMFVVVDSPKMAESWGSTVAGPIFKEIAENSLDYLGLQGMGTTIKN